jgi:hypothetical protein
LHLLFGLLLLLCFLFLLLFFPFLLFVVPVAVFIIFFARIVLDGVAIGRVFLLFGVGGCGGGFALALRLGRGFGLEVAGAD